MRRYAVRHIRREISAVYRIISMTARFRLWRCRPLNLAPSDPPRVKLGQPFDRVARQTPFEISQLSGLPCHGVRRGIHLGTAAQNILYSEPKLARSAGSS